MIDPENKSNHQQGLSVAPSPFNAVKLELAVILIVGLLLWIAVDSITNSDVTQIVILLVFGVFGAAWLILRTHILLRRIQNQNK